MPWTPSRWAEHPVLLLVGKGPGAAREREEFCALRVPADECRLNHAGLTLPGAFKHWYAHDRDMLEIMAAGARGAVLHSCNLVPELAGSYRHWPLNRKCGGSALQAARIALRHWGYARVVLAGIGLDSGVYKELFLPAFARFRPELTGRLRSLGGETAVMYGKPTKEWLYGFDT
jgi:hypothetical protein